MHGRLKVRTSAEEAIRKKKEQEIKVKAYRAGMSKILAKRGNGELDDEMLMITGQILSRNPDVYTLWNIRKECILKLADSMEIEAKQSLFSRDLGFTEQCLMVNPKSYGAWHHRCWILENCPTPDWEKEVALCNKYLKLDERNFHCWDYRRFVVEKAKIPPIDELNYCTEKIRKNFSNYSSWHYRSKLLPILYPHEINPIRPISELKLKEELEMVLTAAFTDPNDSSAWFYQRWLLGYSQPALDIAAVRISANMALISFSKPIDIKTCNIETNFGVNMQMDKWQPTQTGQNCDTTWIITDPLQLSISDLQPTLRCKMSDGKEFLIELKYNDGEYCGVKCPQFGYEFGAAIIEELKNQLDSCNQLLEYEPDSKWTLLTASLLMRSVDRKGYHEKSLEYLRKLEKIDFLRKGYYCDLATKWEVENRLEKWIALKDCKATLDLSHLNLTSVFYENYMCTADDIDLGHNNIMDRTITKFIAFQFCKSLDVSYNNISTPGVIPHLPKLNLLSLEGNKFSDITIADLGEKMKNI